ncbi:MAG: membrane protein insertase YidC [Nakamurella sp.]
MTFNFWSLDYIYYPVSGIMWVWHKVFGSFLGPNTALTWVLSVVFLIFTLRAILFKPFMKQMESQLKMQAVQPQMKKLREKYKDDKQRLSEEMMKLNKEAGVNPLASCLPALIQAPVFIGLFHVLRMFQPVNDGPEGPGVWFYRDSVYFFGHTDVVSMGEAKLPGGAPLVGFMTMPLEQLNFMAGDRTAIILWGIPLTILAGIATHLTSRRSVARQREMNIDTSGSPQTAIMNKLMLYMFPLFVVVGGPFFPLAILFYWLANNSWTFGQLKVAHTLQDRKRAAAALVVDEVKEQAKFSTPKPGARPKASNRPVIEPTKIADSNGSGANGTAASPAAPTSNGGTAKAKSAPAAGAKPNLSKTAGSKPAAKPAPGSKPAPGARPQRTAGKKKNTQR